MTAPAEGKGAARVREPGLAKDTDKLVRRLSLVALLLSRGGQPVSGEQIRSCVEGYPLMTEDAFKRRFYEDRTELARLGIEIAAEHAEDGGDLYRLPADAYYLPLVELTQEELTALGACLSVLQDRFSYSQPLRLALLSLAQGRPEVMAEAAAPALSVLPEAGPDAGVAALPKLQAAIADRKTVLFDYFAIGRNETLNRRVDPYGLQLVAGEWYLVGRCHLREALRTFRLSRIRSRVTHATRAPHDFDLPPGFDLSALRNRPPWQLAEPRGRATISVSPAMAWWVEAHWSHCGTITPRDDGGLLYETAYAEARPLLSWVLGMADDAQVLQPEELRTRVVQQLHGLCAALDAPPDLAKPAPAAAPESARHRATADWRVEVDRYTRLTALAGHLLQLCPGDDEVLLDAAEIRATLGIDDDQLRADVGLLNLVSFGAGGTLLYAEFAGDGLRVTCDLAGPSFKRPSRLAPLQADTLLLAIELVGGHLPTGSGAALASAAAKLREVRSTTATTLTASDLLHSDDSVLDTVNEAVRQHRLLAIEYWAEGTRRVSTRTVEPYLLLRSPSEWYYVCWCRTAGGTRVFRVDTTKQARLLDETFAPRPDIELDLYRQEGIPTTGSYAPMSALVWYSPQVRRWIAERQPVQDLEDGACLASQPYVDESWLVRYLLRFGEQARPLEPPAAVAALRATVERLLADYGAA